MNEDKPTPEDLADQAVIEEIRARGPVWIPGDRAFQMMDEIQAEAEASTPSGHPDQSPGVSDPHHLA